MDIEVDVLKCDLAVLRRRLIFELAGVVKFRILKDDGCEAEIRWEFVLGERFWFVLHVLTDSLVGDKFLFAGGERQGEVSEEADFGECVVEEHLKRGGLKVEQTVIGKKGRSQE